MTTDERNGFLHAILHAPADDTVRGAYADALRESDDPFDQFHGRFMWAGLALARFRGLEPVGDGMFFDAIAEQAASAPKVLTVQIKALLGWEWERCAWTHEDAAPDRVTVGLIPPKVDGETKRQRQSRRKKAPPNAAVIWERGCVAGLRVYLETWRSIAQHVLTHCPLERVEVIDVPGLTLKIGPEPSGQWRLTGELNLPRRPHPHGGGVAYPPKVLTEPWGMSSRKGLVDYILTATDDTLDLLRSEAGFRWPGSAAPIAQDDVLDNLIDNLIDNAIDQGINDAINDVPDQGPLRSEDV